MATSSEQFGGMSVPSLPENTSATSNPSHKKRRTIIGLGAVGAVVVGGGAAAAIALTRGSATKGHGTAPAIPKVIADPRLAGAAASLLTRRPPTDPNKYFNLASPGVAAGIIAWDVNAYEATGDQAYWIAATGGRAVPETTLNDVASHAAAVQGALAKLPLSEATQVQDSVVKDFSVNPGTGSPGKKPGEIAVTLLDSEYDIVNQTVAPVRRTIIMQAFNLEGQAGGQPDAFTMVSDTVVQSN